MKKLYFNLTKILYDQNYRLPSKSGLDLEQDPTFPSQVIDPVTKWHAEENENKT